MMQFSQKKIIKNKINIESNTIKNLLFQYKAQNYGQNFQKPFFGRMNY